MKPIRAMHIASGDIWGGAEAQVHISCKGFIELDVKDIELSCFIFNSGNLSSKIQELPIPVCISEEKNGFLNLIVDIWQFAKMTDTQILISHGYKEGMLAWIASKLLNLKWIHYIHGTSESLSGFAAIKGNFYSLIDKFLYRASANRIVTVSRKIATDLGLINLDKLKVIHNAAETEVVSPKSNEDKIKICWLGRLMPIKRPDIAIKGFRKFLENQQSNNVELHIYGVGPLFDDLKKLIGNTPHILLKGFTDSPNQIISDCNLVLLTSDSEGIPTVLLEAMHNKTPMVSRLVGGIPEIIESVSGCSIVAIENDSIEACASSIEFAISNLNDLKQAAENCDSSYFMSERLVKEQIQLLTETA